MKNAIIAFALLLGSTVVASAQTNPTSKEASPAPAKPKTETAGTSDKQTMPAKPAKPAKPALKKHVCTAACKDGKHVYAHGEKGHVCTDACKAAATNAASAAKQTTSKPAAPMAEKAHVCTPACKDGHHVYAHGEKGHVCTDACKKKM